MNKVIYEQKFNFYKEKKYLVKCNKYLFKMGINEIEINSIGGNYNEITYIDAITFTLKNNNEIIYYLKEEQFLGQGGYGTVKEYKMYKGNEYIKNVVVKYFKNDAQYQSEKNIYFDLKKNNISEKVSCKLLYLNDIQQILIFDYLGITLSKLDFTNISIFDRLKMIEDLCNENLEFFNNKYIHNDLKLDNIVYNPSTKKLSLIDYGLAIKLDYIDIIKTSYQALSSYHSEILNLCDTVEKMNLSADLSDESLRYTKYAYRTQLYVIGLISACILCGDTKYLKYYFIKHYFGEYDKSDFKENFKKFSEDKCKQFINVTLNDMKKNKAISENNMLKLLIYLCNFGYIDYDKSSDEKQLLNSLKNTIVSIKNSINMQNQNGHISKKRRIGQRDPNIS
jgi:serine/threonine protein kinase